MDIIEKESFVDPSHLFDFSLKKTYETPKIVALESMMIQGGQVGSREASGLWES
jgi:hypothetical protein